MSELDAKNGSPSSAATTPPTKSKKRGRAKSKHGEVGMLTASLRDDDDSVAAKKPAGPRAVSKCVCEGCPNQAVSGSRQCRGHGGGKRCLMQTSEIGPDGEPVMCPKSAQGSTEYCAAHGGGLRCGEAGCGRAAVRGVAAGALFAVEVPRCRAHGGGKRCKWEDCTFSAQSSTSFCKTHGGGIRCASEGCNKAAVGVATGGERRCLTHGGGRCSELDCTRMARAGASVCIQHGGGRTCGHDGCNKAARGLKTPFCFAHGGGPRCEYAGCTKARRYKKLCTTHHKELQNGGLLGELQGALVVMDGLQGAVGPSEGAAAGGAGTEVGGMGAAELAVVPDLGMHLVNHVNTIREV